MKIIKLGVKPFFLVLFLLFVGTRLINYEVIKVKLVENNYQDKQLFLLGLVTAIIKVIVGAIGKLVKKKYRQIEPLDTTSSYGIELPRLVKVSTHTGSLYLQILGEVQKISERRNSKILLTVLFISLGVFYSFTIPVFSVIGSYNNKIANDSNLFYLTALSNAFEVVLMLSNIFIQIKLFEVKLRRHQQIAIIVMIICVLIELIPGLVGLEQNLISGNRKYIYIQLLWYIITNLYILSYAR